MQGKTSEGAMDIDAKAVRERIDKLRQEISALIATDKDDRIRGSIVGWNDRKQHDIRLERIQEIKEELQKLKR